VLIDRVAKGVAAVLPPRVVVSSALTDRNGDVLVRVAKELLRVRWLERGSAIVLQTRLSNNSRPDLVMAAHMSSTAQLAATEAGVGWLDETGAAQFAVGTVVVSRTSVSVPVTARPAKRWTAATLGIAEALLTGVPGTVRALGAATGAAPSTVSLALNFLAHTGLLTSQAARGRNSGRSIAEPGRLLEAYADAVTNARETPCLRVGVLWRDPLEGLFQIGQRWDDQQLAWAATGALSAAALAPLQTQVAPVVVCVDALSLATLADAGQAGCASILVLGSNRTRRSSRRMSAPAARPAIAPTAYFLGTRPTPKVAGFHRVTTIGKPNPER